MGDCEVFEVIKFNSLTITLYTHYKNIPEQSKKKIEHNNNETLRIIVLLLYDKNKSC